MKKFSGYDEIQTNEFEVFEKIKPGAHICKIIDAHVETVKYQNGEFDQLILKIDTDVKDTQPKYYSNLYVRATAKDSNTAKWSGIYKIFVPKDDGSENDKKSKEIFKRFTTCVEKSNSGYKWDWEESSLKGKLFVGVFAVEEFRNAAGELAYAIKCKFVRSTENDINLIEIPDVKLEDKSYMSFEDWEEKWEERRSGVTVNENPVEDDDRTSILISIKKQPLKINLEAVFIFD